MLEPSKLIDKTQKTCCDCKHIGRAWINNRWQYCCMLQPTGKYSQLGHEKTKLSTSACEHYAEW